MSSNITQVQSQSFETVNENSIEGKNNLTKYFRIKTFINNRPAYLITGVSHLDDLAVSEYLDIPIYGSFDEFINSPWKTFRSFLGCEPEVSYLYSTKSGSKRIFKFSNVPMPFGEYDIYNSKHLFEALTRLILEHVNIQRWIFKIDDHFDGLGIAYCDIAAYLPSYSNLFKSLEKGDNQTVQVRRKIRPRFEVETCFSRKSSTQQFSQNYRMF